MSARSLRRFDALAVSGDRGISAYSTSAPLRLLDQIAPAERVTFGAFRPQGSASRRSGPGPAALDVHSVRDSLKMARIAARLVPTKVVNFEASGYFADKHGIGMSMGLFGFAASYMEAAIAYDFVGSPFPATGLREPDFAPEPIRQARVAKGGIAAHCVTVHSG